MGKLWCFGDSFTEGHGCQPGHTYYDSYTENRNQIWPDILGSKLDLEVLNLGYGGNSNPYILSQVLENLSNFSKKDLIIIQQTIPERGVIGNLETGEMTWIPSEVIGQNIKDDWLLEPFSNIDAFESYKGYILDILLPQSHIFYDWHKKQFENITKFLVKTGFNAYLWSFAVWGDFESINYNTKGKVPDLHWSWEGHNQFANSLYKRMQKGIFIPEKRN